MSADEVLLLYCDGAARGNPGPAGAGVVLQRPSGEVVERCGRYLGEATNNVAEYEALLLGLERARARGAREVHVMADSQLMIRQLEGAYKVRAAHLKPRVERARQLISSFERVVLRHVPREENRAADQMANLAIDERLQA